MANDKQKTYWSEVAGPKWLSLEGAMEARLAPVSTAVIAAAGLKPGQRVLDIGCGAGRTSQEAAQAVGETGYVLGIDIAPPMIEAARTHAAAEAQPGMAPVEFALADAQTERFTPPFDMLISRFGVMFFEDPVAAFANLRVSVTPGGRLAFAAWAPLAANPHWEIPLRLVEALVGPGAPRVPHAPGPLAFDDANYVRGLLEAAGWRGAEIRVEPVFLHGASLDDEARVACFMGPAGALLDEKKANDATRDAAREAVRGALPGFATVLPDGSLRLPAAIHLITASAP
ncbi:class I SAM-dependent methyltransferase [Acidocella aromatica]|uniref:SAM-dependent methyltransferase n=1 Tax=Acidocella aromatica TaxID=1303579 RepID=A0A840VGC8_9PROT|nr:class I SAM-dependent methyltransferase [Acidocella aromatica]MBB5372255.1 SAM-dependent methyltransferase [Acidocella aromatica]